MKSPLRPPPAPPPPPRQALSWIKPEQQSALTANGTTAYRLASTHGGWVERLGEDVLISYQDNPALEALTDGLTRWLTLTHWQPTRLFHRFLPRQNTERSAPVLYTGDPGLPLTTVVTEANVRYCLDFAAGYSHGLFLDQRSNRARLATMRPRRLLNTFAYTCSFSVVAALQGAETVNLDLSKKSLDRGRENFVLNGLDPAAHRFLAADVFGGLAKLADRKERFDAIILDPPTFSHSPQGHRWQVEQHLDDLINAALELAGPTCSLLLSTNCTKLDVAMLEQTARRCAKAKRRTAQYNRTARPLDFPPPHGAITLWMEVR